MLKTSVHCLLILFTFENLIVHGLINEEVIKEKPKPLAVEILHEKLLPRETQLTVALLNGTNVTDTSKSGKVSIEGNFTTTRITNANKTSDLKFNVQNTTANATVISDNKDGNKTEEYNEHGVDKEINPNNKSAVADINDTIKPINETKITSENKTEIDLNTEETTMESELTTDISEKTSMNASLPEISSTTSNSSLVSTDSTASMNSSTVEDTTASDNPQQSEIYVEEKRNEKMSSGIIALVMAIVFAIVVIIVYISLLVWRRYLEYRYGNRELLVNDLEFDTNDLRHFEL